MATRFADLVDLLEEEAEISEDNPIMTTLNDVANKLRQNNTDLTPAEREAILYALEDLGELYENAGTAAGFDADESFEDAKHMRDFAGKAIRQARTLGIGGE